MIRLSKIGFTSVFLVAALVLIGVQRAEAKTFNVKASFSGTSHSVPIDLDGATCTTVGLVTTCPRRFVRRQLQRESHWQLRGTIYRPKC